jgi:hypothetical protein
MEADRRGLPLTTSSEPAASAHRDGVERFLRGVPGSGDAFTRATGEDPSFAEAHVGVAFAAFYDGDMAGTEAALAQADACATSERARGQAALVRGLSQLDPSAVSAAARPHLSEYPTDDLAREAVGLLNFFLGRSDAIIDLYDWLAPGQEGDWAFAASWSFACHEVGRLPESQRLGELALAARPDHVFATHSLAHVAYESGRHSDGAELITSYFEDNQPLAFQQRHLRWHLALHRLALGDEPGARDLWRAAIAPTAVATTLGAVEDGVGLLWRWHLYGLAGWDLPWDDLGERAREVAALPVIPLPAACASVVLVALGDEGSLSALLTTADDLAAAGMPVPAPLLRAVAAAARASFAGAWAEVADTLLAVRPHLSTLGGSRAQRELFDDALLAGLLGSGQGDAAGPILRERLARRPSTREDALLAGIGR